MSAAPILTVLRNGEMLKAFSIEDEALLGRGEGCVIRLEDRAISRQHAVFRRTADGVQLEKRSEFGPILLNGAECTSAIVKDGDVINIGPYLMKMSISRDAKVSFGAPSELDSGSSSNSNSSEFESNVNSSDLVALSTAPPGIDSSVVSPDAAIEVVGGFAPPDEPAMQPALDSSVTTPEGSAIEPPVGASSDALGVESPSSLESNVAPDYNTGVMVDESASTKLVAAAKIDVQLVFSPGTANHTTFPLDRDEVSIGRGKGCDIIINDKRSSRKNTVIQRSGAVFIIRDLNSSNGTFVNGARITEAQLSGDDKIRIGDVEFEFKALSADYAAREG
ncbi:MAG: FHA domain-containing protein, partial [Bdellovibrionota bacterium]